MELKKDIKDFIVDVKTFIIRICTVYSNQTEFFPGKMNMNNKVNEYI